MSGTATNETRDLIASDKVEGTAVYNGTGDRLGTVYNFMVDKQFIIPFFGAQAMVLRGWALVEKGGQDEGLAELRRGLMTYRETRCRARTISIGLGLMAEACGKARQVEGGLRVVSEALRIDRNGVRYYEAELHRVEGKLLLSLASRDEWHAEESFRRAVEIARAQDAKSFELRASTSLARLWRHQGKRAEARGLLDPIYSWFTEGFDTKDLQDAKSLLGRTEVVEALSSAVIDNEIKVRQEALSKSDTQPTGDRLNYQQRCLMCCKRRARKHRLTGAVFQ